MFTQFSIVVSIQNINRYFKMRIAAILYLFSNGSIMMNTTIISEVVKVL